MCASVFVQFQIHLNIFVIALQLTLLISFISAETNESNLRKQFNHDLKDSNSDLKWWEYFIAAASNTKETNNIVPLEAESAAFDVVQTHLSDDEIPDEEETPKVVAPTKSSVGDVKSSSRRPAVAQTTTQAPVKRKTVQPTRSQPAVKTVTKQVQTTTSSSLSEGEDDEEELDNNTIVIKPSSKKTPAAPQPTKSRPASALPRKPVVTTTRPIVTTTSSSLSESDEEEPIVATTRRPTVVQPKRPQISSTKTPTKSTSGGVKGGTKAKAVPSRPSARPVVTTTTRSIVTTESEEDEEESLPATRGRQLYTLYIQTIQILLHFCEF